MKFTRKRTGGINHWNESRIANMVQGNHDKPAAPLIIVEFEDHGQDFLLWTIDATTGEVVGCDPFQASVWCGKYVKHPELLEQGGQVIISDSPIDLTDEQQEFLTIIYPLSKVLK